MNSKPITPTFVEQKPVKENGVPKGIFRGQLLEISRSLERLCSAASFELYYIDPMTPGHGEPDDQRIAELLSSIRTNIDLALGHIEKQVKSGGES